MKKDDCFTITDTINNSINGTVLGVNPKIGYVTSITPEMVYGNRMLYYTSHAESSRMKDFIVNDLFQIIKRGESFVVSDIKADMIFLLQDMCKSSGYTVKVFNPFKKESLLCDTLADGVDLISTLYDRNGIRDCEVENAIAFATSLMNGTYETVTDGLLNDIQMALLTAVILYTMYYEAKDLKEPLRTMSAVYHLLADNNVDELHNLFLQFSQDTEKDETHSHPAWNQYLTYYFCEESHLNNEEYLLHQTSLHHTIREALLMRLGIFASEDVCKQASLNEIDLCLPAREKCAYFVMECDDFCGDVLTNLFIDSLITQIAIQDKLAIGDPSFKRVPVNMFLPVLPHILGISAIEMKMRVIRDYIRITFLAETPPRHLAEMGADVNWRLLMSDCDVHIFFGTDNMNYHEFMRQHLRCFHEFSEPLSVMWSEIFTDLPALLSNECVVLIEGNGPFLFNTIPCKEHPLFPRPFTISTMK